MTEEPKVPAFQPIETSYGGCRFRSRLEARWAVFFDHLRIKWEYEPQGYLINGRPYLPDFVLPEMNTVVEVKGDHERLDVELLANALDSKNSWLFALILGPVPNPNILAPLHSVLTPAFDVRPGLPAVPVVNEYFAALERVGDEADRSAIRRMVDSHRRTTVVMTRACFIPQKVSALVFPVSLTQWPMNPEAVLESAELMQLICSPRLKAAYQAARSARFEHGESGPARLTEENPR
jgi:hypothetical protein